ncbi:MAG: TetR family transcriptional regulator [Ruminococcaceae bacterium]|nr:TetR family transcriptional regulator [Oscillospiraceae bacterium]
MQKDTKKLIYETFVQLLEKKPFDRITVKDIVEACEINRNTFYYYYSDIYDVLEEIFMKELNELLGAHKEGKSWAESFIKIAYVAYSHKKIINNICASRSYEYLENYMYKVCNNVMIELVQDMAQGMDVPESDIEFIASFYEYAFVGVISEWFRTGMREEPLELASRFALVVGNMKYSLRKSEKNQRLRKENED